MHTQQSQLIHNATLSLTLFVASTLMNLLLELTTFPICVANSQYSRGPISEVTETTIEVTGNIIQGLCNSNRVGARLNHSQP